jgi:phage-related protein
VRTKDAAFLTLLESDSLDLVVLLEIQRSSDALRYALDTEPRTWNGQVFAATSGALGEMKESAERQVPALQLVLQNADGVLGPLVHAPSGGEDLRGRRVNVYQASRTLLTGPTPTDLVVEWTFFINAYSWIGRDAVAFELGVFPAERVRVPDRTMQGIRCRWVTHFKGLHCGYVGELATCAGTVEDCKNHFYDAPLRFGGFPGSADARALRVE